MAATWEQFYAVKLADWRHHTAQNWVTGPRPGEIGDADWQRGTQAIVDRELQIGPPPWQVQLWVDEFAVDAQYIE